MLCEHRTKFGILETIFIKMVYIGTHDNVFIARQSHDSGKTLSRQPQDSDTIKKMSCTTNVQLLCDKHSIMCKHRTKFGIREKIVRLYHECLATVVGLSYDSRTTVVRLFLLKWVYVGSHDNVFIARQSLDCNKTLSPQPPDSDTTKYHRAKKVHVQFSSHDTRQHHDAKKNRATVVRWSQMTHDLTNLHVVALLICVVGSLWPGLKREIQRSNLYHVYKKRKTRNIHEPH